MAKKKTPSNAKPAKTALVETAQTLEAADAPEKKSRKLKQTEYKSFRLQKRIKADAPKVLGGFKIFKQAMRMLGRYWKVFLGISLLYALFNIILVQSFAGLNINDSKATIESIFTGQWSRIVSGFSIFAYLVGTSAASASQTAGAYQFMLLLLTSLASIWAIRQAYQGGRMRIRDAYYQGMRPLVQFLLVFAVLLIQMMPIIVGSFLYSFASSSGGVTGTELALWLAAIFMLSVLSLYMLSSSIFALYIVCLPDITPMVALRSARALVKYRRWLVMRRILFLPFVLLVIGGLIMIPVIAFVTPLAVAMFFALTILVVPVIHAYLYRLYRELL